MFCKRLTASAFVATFLALCACPGQAAPVPLPREAPPADEKAIEEALNEVDGRLLMNRKVLRDMRCTIDQLDQVLDVLEDADRKANETMMNAMIQLKMNLNMAMNPQAIEQMIRDAQTSGERHFRDAARKVMSTQLSLAQRKRLRELDLQTRGATALTLPTVVKALQLTDAQKDKIAGHIKAAETVLVNKQVPMPVQGPFDFEKAIREARESAAKQAVDVLTEEQKVVWKKLVGEPSKFPLPAPRGMHGFGFGGVAIPAQKIAPPIDMVPPK